VRGYTLTPLGKKILDKYRYDVSLQKSVDDVFTLREIKSLFNFLLVAGDEEYNVKVSLNHQFIVL
jgi:hypothetical protein